MYFENIFDGVNHLINQYLEKGGDFVQKQGSLLDEYCFYGKGLKYTLLLERYLNSNSSTYTVKQFKKLPQKRENYFFNED